ncbi:hypothetical protein CGCF413_v002097 [Colletotrichum fructicola]|nr:hypothetical protein CGCF413_v002097 [Colletotrichum fructicola]
MTYCDFCSELTVDSLLYQDVRFHDNVKSLKESAEAGCDFCGLCWASIKAQCMPRHLTELLNGEIPSSLDDLQEDQPWYPSIWLHGQIVPIASDSANGVWITCGRSRASVLNLPETNPPGSPLQVKLSSYAVAGSAAASIYPERLLKSKLYTIALPGALGKTVQAAFGARPIDNFTLRTLSNPHDVFAAMASLAKLAHGALGSHYAAGLWEDDIARGLLWKPRHHVHRGFRTPPVRPRPTELAPFPVVRAPSWSWASVEGPIFHQHTRRKFKDFEKPGFIKIKRHPGNNRWTVDEYCDVDALHMPHCELSLVGHVARALVLDTPVADYVSNKQRDWWKFWWKTKAKSYGVLLADAEEACADSSTLSEKVVAIGREVAAGRLVCTGKGFMV